MNTDKIKEILGRIPIGLILVAYAGYLGFDYYTFTTAPESPLIQKQAEYETLKKGNVELQAKIKKANDFFKSLDAKKAELRKLAQTLDELKGTVTTDIDIPGFMKMIVTEARRVGLNVMGIKPQPLGTAEFYEEQPFELNFRGVYVQLLVFLDRLASVQNIVRVDDFDIHPISVSTSRFVELEGTVQVKAYKYLGTKADELGRGKAVASAQGTVPASVTPGTARPAAKGGQ